MTPGTRKPPSNGEPFSPRNGTVPPSGHAYFDSIDNSAYILGKAPHSARTSWIYIDGESFAGAALGADPRV